MEEQRLQEDEIDLRPYLKVIAKRRSLILGILFAVIIVTAIVSISAPRVYRATALVLIASSKSDNFLDAPRFSLDAANNAKTWAQAGRSPSIAIPTHKMLMPSGVVLQRVINKLNLVNQAGGRLQPDDLLRRLFIREEAQTNVFQLAAKDSDPAAAMNLANVWAREYIQYTQELIAGEVKGMGDFVGDQFILAKKNLYEAEQKVAAFKIQYKVDLMQAELDLKKGKWNSYKADLLNVEVALKTQEDLLKELRAQIANQDQFIITSKAITDDALWQKASKVELDKQKLRSESVNPIYQDLKTRIINTETELNTNRSKVGYLRELIASTEKDINALEKTLDQKQIESNQLTREEALYKQIYDNLSSTIEQTRIANAAQLGEVRLVSPAYEPSSPESRNTLRKMILAGIAGLAFGVLGAFIKEGFAKN